MAGIWVEDRRRRLGIALAIVVWTAIAWGGRIGLLTEDGSIWAWGRIGGSLLVALMAVLALLSPIGDRLAGGFVALFVVWTVVLWTRSLAVNWAGSGSLAFKLVHTVLASGFFVLAWFVWRERRALIRRDPVKSES